MAHTHATRPKWGVTDRYRMGIMLFLVAAGASFLLSIGLWFTDNRDEGVFVGLWVPSILAAGAFWLTAMVKRS
jgi:hypothetical protein